MKTSSPAPVSRAYFYIKYHLYKDIFPLTALGRFLRTIPGSARLQPGA